MKSYYLAPHVYPCVTNDHVVLLDLRRDKYIGVGRAQMAALAAHVNGWPLVIAAEPGAANASVGAVVPTSAKPAENLLAKMVADGMLTTDSAAGKVATPVEIALPEAALVDDDLETQPPVTFRHAVRFLRASALAALEMRLRPIESVMRRARRRKARRGGRTSTPVERSEARKAVGAFIRLRPLLFGAQDACLYDSLALCRYLSYYGIFPTCVIGVQTGPFVAHCWVQDGPVIFNDAPEYVRRYTPILAV